MDQSKIGKIIKDKRIEKKFTQVELAEKLGVSNRTISKWENGNGLPDYSIVNDLCDVLDLTVEELLSGEKNVKTKVKKNSYKKYIVMGIVLLIIWILYKLFMLFYCGMLVKYEFYENSFPYNTNISNLEVKNNFKSNTKMNDGGEFYFYVPKGFKLVTDKAESGLVMDGCDVYLKNKISKDEFDSLLIVCMANHDTIYNLDHFGIRSSFFPCINVYKTLKKNNINDTLDIIKYYEDNYDYKNNIFTSSNKIAMNYIARNYVTMSIGSYDNFYYLDGDLRGYLVEFNENNYYANIYFKNDVYRISMSNYKGEYFNYDSVLEIVNSFSNS